MRARRINYDAIGLAETRKSYPLNAVSDNRKELFVEKYGSWGFGILFNMGLVIIIDSLEQLTTRTGCLWLKRSGSISALPVFAVYAPTSSYEEDEVEAFYMDMDKFYRGDPRIFGVIIGYFNAKIRHRRTSEERHVVSHGFDWREAECAAVLVYYNGQELQVNWQSQKPHSRRWTWESSSLENHDEIGHIMVNRGLHYGFHCFPRILHEIGAPTLSWKISFLGKRTKMHQMQRTESENHHKLIFIHLVSWEDPVLDNVEGEWEWLILFTSYVCAMKADSSKVI